MKNLARTLSLALFLALTLLSHTAKAWWDTGHMVVAQIAYNELKPEAQKWAVSLIDSLRKLYPQTHNFVEAATWPDDIKGNGITAYSSWHYTNIPLNEDGVAISCDATPEVDIVWAIGQARSILSSPKSTPFEKGQFLAFLIHFVGDLHQPLHSTSVYTNSQPGGNMGGNLFALKDSLHNNLHKLWDDGCGYFDSFGKLDRKPGPTAWQPMIEDIAKAIQKAYPEKNIPAVAQLDPAIWALESHNLAVKMGYQGLQVANGSRKDQLKPNDTPSPFYLESGRKVVEMQIATAGYRLARIITEIYAGKTGK